MTISDLRVLVDNLDEYIHIPNGIARLKKTVLHLAISGKLVPQIASEGTGEELYNQIQSAKTKVTAKKQKSLSEISDEEAPFNAPASWIWVRLGNIITLKSGADLTPDKYNDNGDGIPYITGASHIDNEKVIVSRWTTEPKNLAESGDLLITCKGTIGTMAFLGVKEAHIARQIMAIKFNDFLQPNFIKSVISTNIDSLKEVAQSMIPGISRDDMLSMFIALPPLGEQKRIVKKVNEIFALIDELDSKYKAEEAERSRFVKSSLRALSHDKLPLALDNLADTIKTKADAAELRKAILHIAISGQLVPQIPNEGTGEELYKQIQSAKSRLNLKMQKLRPEITKEELPFEIPSSWKWVRLAEVYDVRDGTHDTPKYTSQGYPLITSKNLSSGKLSFDNVQLISESDYVKIKARSEVSRDDILFAMIGSIGNPVIVDTDEKFAIKNVALFKPIGGFYNPNWLLNGLELFTASMKEQSAGGVQSFVSLSFLRGYNIPLPPLAEQERIVNKTTELFNLVTQLEKHLEK